MTPEDVKNIRDRLTIAELGAQGCWIRGEDEIGAKYDREAEMWRRILAALSARQEPVAWMCACGGVMPWRYKVCGECGEMVRGDTSATHLVPKRLHPATVATPTQDQSTGAPAGG